ncbi:Cell division topological specificity factor [Buchnera aphidicola (Panaphis juglandis)]
MSLLDFFLSRRKNTASIAKKRLNIIFEKKNNIIDTKSFLSLKNELLLIINKYINHTPNMLSCTMHKNTSHNFIIEINLLTYKN